MPSESFDNVGPDLCAALETVAAVPRVSLFRLSAAVPDGNLLAGLPILVGCAASTVAREEKRFCDSNLRLSSGLEETNRAWLPGTVRARHFDHLDTLPEDDNVPVESPSYARGYGPRPIAQQGTPCAEMAPISEVDEGLWTSGARSLRGVMRHYLIKSTGRWQFPQRRQNRAVEAT